MNHTARRQLRKQMRQQRCRLSAKQQQQHSQKLLRQFKQQYALLSYQHIAVYLSNDGEIDINPIIAYLLSLNKHCYLPVIKNTAHKKMYFAPYHDKSIMESNIFSILQPKVDPAKLYTPQQLDVILMPLVAFDKQGNRLGMGGGFFDQSLRHLRYRKYYKKPKLIGIAHHFQESKQLPTAPWDIPLDQIITELFTIPTR